MREDPDHEARAPYDPMPHGQPEVGVGPWEGAWPDALALTLTASDDGARALTAHVPAAWEGRWPPR